MKKKVLSVIILITLVIIQSAKASPVKLSVNSREKEVCNAYLKATLDFSKNGLNKYAYPGIKFEKDIKIRNGIISFYKLYKPVFSKISTTRINISYYGVAVTVGELKFYRASQDINFKTYKGKEYFYSEGQLKSEDTKLKDIKISDPKLIEAVKKDMTDALGKEAAEIYLELKPTVVNINRGTKLNPIPLGEAWSGQYINCYEADKIRMGNYTFSIDEVLFGKDQVVKKFNIDRYDNDNTKEYIAVKVHWIGSEMKSTAVGGDSIDWFVPSVIGTEDSKGYITYDATEILFKDCLFDMAMKEHPQVVTDNGNVDVKGWAYVRVPKIANDILLRVSLNPKSKTIVYFKLK